MCGILGIVNPDKLAMQGFVGRMLESLTHRGPDDQGIYEDPNLPVILGHRRLSIMDLSSFGHQPMSSANGRYTVVFNGEIYNFKALRQELLSLECKFAGNSDTEVLVACLEAYGVECALNKLEGMFAIAVLDKVEECLHLIRDRIGEKPLYYGWLGSSFMFASELRAFRHHPDWNKNIDLCALSTYFRLGYVPAPLSIIEGIYKLQPGSIIDIPLKYAQNKDLFSYEISSTTKTFSPRKYWDASIYAEKINSSEKKPFKEHCSEVNRLLEQSVKRQMISDVPLGAFLSSGIDSSLIASIMQSLSNKPIKTFTIGFDAENFDEAPHAKNIADHLGTEHSELYMTDTDVLGLVPNIASIYDEPFADSSQLPMTLLCTMAKQHVTVCLTGDGGDEVFCGYNRYMFGKKIANFNSFVPHIARRSIADCLQLASPQAILTAKHLISKITNTFKNVNDANISQKINKLSAALRCKNSDELYILLLSYWKNPSLLVPNSVERDISHSTERAMMGNNSIANFMLWDQLLYLPDDNLVKVDRASMSVSLETRLPLLSRDLLEYTWTIPREQLLYNGEPKSILKNILYQYVPKELIDRPKMGFSVPLAHWLRGPLRDWAHRLLHAESCNDILNYQIIYTIWEEHLSFKADHSSRIWTLLMFLDWHSNN